MLSLRRHVEVRENDDEEEDVVDAQTQLDEIGREKRVAKLGAPPAIDEAVEDHRQRESDSAPAESLRCFRLAGVTLQHTEVPRHHRGNE